MTTAQMRARRKMSRDENGQEKMRSNMARMTKIVEIASLT